MHDIFFAHLVQIPFSLLLWNSNQESYVNSKMMGKRFNLQQQEYFINYKLSLLSKQTTIFDENVHNFCFKNIMRDQLKYACS